MRKKETKDEKLTIRLPSSLLQQLEQIADAEGRSVSDVTVRFLRAAVDGPRAKGGR